MPDLIDQIHAEATQGAPAGGIATLDPSDVEEVPSPKLATLNPSDVEEAPSSQPRQPSPQPIAATSAAPAGTPGGVLPSVPQPQVNMQVPSIARTLVDGYHEAESRGMQHATVAGPDGQPINVLVPNYGQNALPRVEQGASEMFTPGERTKGATDILGGVNDALSSTILPLGVAPGAVAAGMAAGVAGSYATPKAVKALGGNQQQQDLAREAGATLPLAAGVGTDLLGSRPGLPEVLPPESRVTSIRQVGRDDLPQLGAGITPQLGAGEAAPYQLPEGGSPAAVPNPRTPPRANPGTAIDATRPIPLYPQPEATGAASHYVAGPDGSVQLQPAGLLPADVDQYSIDSSRQHPVARVVGRDANGQPIIQRIPGADISPAPVVGGIAQRQLGAGEPETPLTPQPAPQAPPPLNADTARTRVQPNPPNPTPTAPRGFIAGPDGTMHPVVPQLPGHAPSSADQAQTQDLQNYLASHPSGRVTGIDQASGLPIVDRTQPPLAAQGAMLPPQTATAGPMSPEAEAISAQAAAAAKKTASNPDLKPEIAAATNQAQPVGATDAETGRQITQPSDNPATNQALATDAMPEYKAGLKSAIENIPGAELAADRPAKNPVRLAEKIGDEGQPSETVSDYGAAQISVDSPQALQQVISAVKQQFPTVLREDDNFANGDKEYGYRNYSLQVQMPNGASMELQIVPKEVLDANADEHKNYKQAREAAIDGDKSEEAKNAAAAKVKNDAAMAKFNQRNGANPSLGATLTKGSAVVLPDGSRGTISYLDPNMRIARVGLDRGGSVTMSQSKLSPALARLDPSEVEDAPAGGAAAGNTAPGVRLVPTSSLSVDPQSPLFEGSEANPQSGLFGGLEERHGGLGAIDPTKLLPDAVKDYLAKQADLIGKSREIHGGIYDLAEQHDADVLRANRLMKELPGTPADQAAAYHHLENPKEPLTKTQREILDKLAPFNKEAERIYQKLNPEKKLVPGYVHRIAQQRGSLLDRILQGSKSSGKGNLLKKNASAGKRRFVMVIQGPDGTRVPVSVSRGRVTAWHDNVPTDIGPLRAGMTNPDEILDERLAPLDREEAKLKQEQRTLNQTPSRQAAAGRRLQNITNRVKEIESERAAIEHEHTAENLPDKLWRDKNGDQWTFKQATTKEIERETPIEYYKNAAASTITNWLELRRAERAADYIEKVKNDPEFASFGIKPSNPSQIPDGWHSTRLPQFSGYYFEPHVAEVFDHYAKQLAQGKPGILQQVGDFLTTSIFLNPLSHIPNLTTNWLTEKGISVVNPLQWGREFKATVKAFNAVVHQNQDFLDALDVGAPMESQRTAVRQFADILVKKLQDEAENPSTAEKLAEALGKAVNIPAVMKTAVNFMADKSTWPVHDIYFLQSAYLKMAENPSLTLKQALEDTAKYIPDERLPTRIFNSNAVADVMQNPLLTMFSRYHYGILKGYGQILKNLSDAGFKEEGTNAQGEPVNKAGRTAAQEKAHALNIAAGLAIMLAVVYPALDQLAVKATGNKDARVRRAGSATFADALSRAIQGDITPLQAARSVATPAVLTETGIDLAANRDVFGTGRKIYDPHADGKTIAQQVGRRLAESVSPAQLAMRASESSLSAKKTLLGLIGISFPRHGALKLAAELNADRMGDEAETPEEREKGILRSQARYSAWQGDMSGIAEARKSGLFSAQDMRKLEHEAKENPLLYETRDMPLDDVLKVWKRATPEERKTLLPVLVRKGVQIDSKSRPERVDLRARWRQALAATRQGAP